MMLPGSKDKRDIKMPQPSEAVTESTHDGGVPQADAMISSSLLMATMPHPSLPVSSEGPSIMDASL